MEKRLYFLLPNIETTRNVVRDLLLNYIEKDKIHIVARKGTPLEDLPEADAGQTSDVLPAAQKGGTAGAATGAIAGIAMAAVPAAGIVATGAAVVAIMAAGSAGFGAWVAGMIGLSQDSSRLKKFQEAVEAGELLILVDLPRNRIEEIRELVHKHHPDADIQGTEATIPNFP